MRPQVRSAILLRTTAITIAVLAVSASSAIAGETQLRRNIAWQVALDGVNFSPGLIDGLIGPKTALATREFQRVRGLPATGQLDSATAEALRIDPDNIIGRYTIEQADLNEIGHVPESWVAKSKLKRLGHESLETVIAEKFRCTRGLLRRLNPGVNINRLKAGDRVIVPVVQEPVIPRDVAYLEINLTEKVIRVVNRQKQLVGLFHCSVAASKAKLPRTSQATVTGIAMNPTYTFDPKMWPEVREKVSGRLIIPPGPRNPVGRCWISISLPGYGIHGTPNPELIGKTGSHGCFRLANWDAIRLSKMVSHGTPVRFVDHPDRELANARR